MKRYIFQSPAKYIQGNGVLADLGTELKKIGENPLLLADENVWGIVQKDVEESLTNEVDYQYEQFNEEASTTEVNRIAEIAENHGSDVIVGIGGGKTLDTGKAVADTMSLPVVIVPTAASMDAPTTAIAAIYSDEGVFEEYKFYDQNPELVLVDSGVVAAAPTQMFASGMADAIATAVEFKASMKHAENMAGGRTTLAGQAIAETAEETVFKYGIQAYKAVDENIVTPHVERVIEANTLLSGVGGENVPLAAAHAIHNGFTALDGDIHHLSHGEKVAYGILTQLVLEGYDKDYIDKYISFFKEINMPTTLEKMHLDDAEFDELLAVGEAATAEDETIVNMDPTITAEDVANAILTVDKLSKMKN
jgi:glycerol dehydrogenase